MMKSNEGASFIRTQHWLGQTSSLVANYGTKKPFGDSEMYMKGKQSVKLPVGLLSDFGCECVLYIERAYLTFWRSHCLKIPP